MDPRSAPPTQGAPGSGGGGGASSAGGATLGERLQALNEDTWVRIGVLADSMGEKDRALAAFDAALRHNPFSVAALTHASSLCRQKELYPKAIEYFQRLLNIDRFNGAVWAALGHCFLMTDDLQNAYQTYQQALNCLTNTKDPKLWYGIGVLYDRYGSYDHAEAAFASVLRFDPKFDKGSEVYFRLGIIYKHQQKYSLSLDCFRYILSCPPKPLVECDVWFQIGHVHEFLRDYQSARSAYEAGLNRSPNSVKILQQLGWLCMQVAPGYQNYDQAISFLTRALEIDANDAQIYYLLGRCHMAKQKFNQAYDFYQQAVLRDAKNPIFWCSIGVLYFELGQHRDALDAYSRAIYLNPSIHEIWCNLGKLYESCNSQTADAIDAYTKAVELEPGHVAIKHRLNMLRAFQANQGPAPGPPDAAIHPVPQDPSTYVAGGSTGKAQNVSSSSFFPSVRTAQQQQQAQQQTQQQSQLQQQQYQSQMERRRSIQPGAGAGPGLLTGAGNVGSRGSPHPNHLNGNLAQQQALPPHLQHQQNQQHVSPHQQAQPQYQQPPYPQQIQQTQQQHQSDRAPVSPHTMNQRLSVSAAGNRNGIPSPQASQYPSHLPQPPQSQQHPMHQQQQQQQQPQVHQQQPPSQQYGYPQTNTQYQQGIPPQSAAAQPPQQQAQGQAPPPPQAQQAQQQNGQFNGAPRAKSPGNFPRASGSPSFQPSQLRPTSPTGANYPPPPPAASQGSGPVQQQHYQVQQHHQQYHGSNPSSPGGLSVQTAGPAVHGGPGTRPSSKSPTASRVGSILTGGSGQGLAADSPTAVGGPVRGSSPGTGYPPGLAPVGSNAASSGAYQGGGGEAAAMDHEMSTPAANAAAVSGNNGNANADAGIGAGSVASVPVSMRRVDDDYDEEDGAEPEEGEENGQQDRDEVMGEAAKEEGEEEEEEEIEEGGVAPIQS